MADLRSDQALAFWFIPALLVCVLVLSGLCLFLIRRQSGSEQNQLREQERTSLDKAQQDFRKKVQDCWQTAVKTLPANSSDHPAFQKWDEGLGPDFLGFLLDDSGVLVCPNYRFDALSTPVPDNLRQLLARLFLTGPSAGMSADNGDAANNEAAWRQTLAAAELGDKAKAVSAATVLLAKGLRSVPAVRSLGASVILLETEEVNEETLVRQSALVDAWVMAYQEGWLPLSSNALPWLRRMHEQCRRRNERESWLVREKKLFRETRRVQWAERFLPRLNLLLRRQLYNPTRAAAPLQVLSSDLSEEPFLVLCQFQAAPSFRLAGVVADLQTLCHSLDASFDKAPWSSPDLLVQIRKADSVTPASSGPEVALVERRILDPWAAQFNVEARPRDLNAFQRRALQKNLLYLTLTGLTIGACVLVLYLGSRALKEQHRLSKLRSDFLTNVSHELRTPLTAIRLHAETLERQLAKANLPTAASAETIVGEVDRLSVLINDVLEFTRLENDKKRFVWERVDLVGVLQESIQLFSQQLAEAGFAVSLDLPESLILRRADRAALKQCAVNLISNCLKFSPHEKSILVRLNGENGRAVWVTEDRGIGVLPEDEPRIFDKFYRSANLDPAISGTGLGLTLCKAFVEAHGGSIEWEAPASGSGSRFVIRLPT
jgi:signal transduction histidine kinase